VSPASLVARAARRSALLAHLTAFFDGIRPESYLNVDPDDGRIVLQAATSLGFATAQTAGPDRAASATAQLLAALTGQRLPGTVRTALLGCSSHPEAELEMDELAEITDLLQQQLGPDAEMIFGHGPPPSAPGADLHLWLLVGYA